MAQSHHLEFAPPPPPGLIRAFLLAVLVHGLLLAMLAVGVDWKRDSTTVAVQAELWSAVPQEAAPPPPAPEPEPAPAPQASTPAPPAPDPVDIAQERERARQLQEKKAQEERAQQERALRAQQEQARLKKEQEQAQKLAQEQALKKQQDSKRKELQDQKNKDALDAKKLEALRQQNLKRMAGLAGNTDASATGSARNASGPSAGYSGRIVASIKPRIVFTDSIDSNPRVEVEIRIAPSGTILASRVTLSSGVPSWDDAVLRAIEKTAVLPKDVDGTVPSSIIMGFRPKD